MRSFCLLLLLLGMFNLLDNLCISPTIEQLYVTDSHRKTFIYGAILRKDYGRSGVNAVYNTYTHAQEKSVGMHQRVFPG